MTSSIELPALINEFLDAMTAHNQSIWRQADLVLRIQAHFGVEGLLALRRRCGLTRDHLVELARVADAFPPSTRAPVSFAHHVVALRALTLFPEGSPEHQPSYWLQRAADQRWSRDQMRTRMRQTVATHSNAQDRERILLHRYAIADTQYRHLLDAVAVFNREHAPYRLNRVILVSLSLDPIVSAGELLAAACEAVATQLPQLVIANPPA